MRTSFNFKPVNLVKLLLKLTFTVAAVFVLFSSTLRFLSTVYGGELFCLKNMAIAAAFTIGTILFLTVWSYLFSLEKSLDDKL